MGEITTEEIKTTSQVSSEVKNISKSPIAGEKKDNTDKISQELTAVKQIARERIERTQEKFEEITQKDYFYWAPKNQEKTLNQKIDVQSSLLQLEQLNKIENKDPLENLSNCYQTVEILDSLKKQSKVELNKILKGDKDDFGRCNIDLLKHALKRDTKKIEHIENLPIFQKFFLKRRIKRFIENKNSIAEEINNYEGKIQAKEEEIDQYNQRIQEIKGKQKENVIKVREEFFPQVVEAIKLIKDEYTDLSYNLTKEENILGEIRKNYIQDFILPELKESTKYNGTELTIKEKNQFCSDLQSFLKNEIRNDQYYWLQKDEAHQKLQKFFESHQEFKDQNHLFNSLFEGKDRMILRRLLAQTAAKDIATLDDIAGRINSSEDSPSYGYFSISDTLSIPDWYQNKGEDERIGFGGLIASNFEGGIEWNYWKDMPFWESLKNSKLTKNLFSEEIKEQDEKIYQESLIKSIYDLKDDEELKYIHNLEFYPTPQSIRNLVVIAAAEPRSYRTHHANNVLLNLRKKENWAQVLDETEKVYPFLKPTREILENWYYDTSSNDHRTHPGLKEVISDFCLDIYENTSVEKESNMQPYPGVRLKELASQGIESDRLIDVLIQRKLLENSKGELFKKVDTLLDPFKRYRKMNRKDFENIEGIDTLYLRGRLRGEFFDLLKNKDEKTINKLERLNHLSEKILDNKTSRDALKYLNSPSVIEKAMVISTDKLDFFLDAYKNCPNLIGNKALLTQFCQYFGSRGGENLTSFFNRLTESYAELPDQAVKIAKIVIEDQGLDMQRALELPNKAGDILSGDLFSLATEFPKVYLTADQDCEFFRKMLVSYQQNSQDIREATKSLVDSHMSRELVLAFPQQAAALMGDKMHETRLFIFQHGDSLLKDTSDIKFMNSLVGEFGKKSDQLIRDYQACLGASSISTKDKELVLEFARQFRVISPITIQGYKEAKGAGHEKVYIAQLQALAERMTGSSVITDEERKRPYYKDLLKHVYSNNVGQWSSFESNDSCPDRNSDLVGFKIKPRYEIDLLSQSEMRVKVGETLDTTVKEDVQKPILEVAERMNTLGHDKEKIQTALQENVDKKLQEILQKGGLQSVSLESVKTLDEKLFLILTDSIYGSRLVDPDAIKDLIVTYEFATFEDISDYIAGTSDRVGRANNQDYALLCELGTFYSDRIKEVNRRLVQAAWNNPTIEAAMPEYFKKLAQDTTMVQRRDLINRLQIDRLGVSDSFIKQAGKMLEKRKGRKYNSSEVKKLIQRYEDWAGGLVEKSSISPKSETKAFYGQLRSQREKTFEALKAITGQEIDSRQTHLGEINLQQVLATETNIREGEYDGEQFASYTVQRFIDLFEEERTKIDKELAKFESLSGKQREILYGYITKSKESSNARMVGGVCVAGDNPDKRSKENIWSMPNYFQMIFQEPDTLQCQGLVLLHHFNESGKRILTASLNPSSTYLYSVDEAALFKGIASSLGQFATENGFDMVVVPNNKTIRTNRTGGEFEKAMDKRVAQVGKTFKFDAAQQFSYHPNYQIQEMDVIWEKQSSQ